MLLENGSVDTAWGNESAAPRFQQGGPARAAHHANLLRRMIQGKA